MLLTIKHRPVEVKVRTVGRKGGTCMSCVYTIEHLGKKIDGAEDVYVDIRSGKIYVEYRGSSEALESIAGIVRRIGYRATPLAEASG